MSARRREGGLSQLGVGLPKGLGLLSSPGGPCRRLHGGAGVKGDAVARVPTPDWAPSALAWDTPPASSQIPLNPSSLLTYTELSQPKAAWGRPDL